MKKKLLIALMLSSSIFASSNIRLEKALPWEDFQFYNLTVPKQDFINYSGKKVDKKVKTDTIEVDYDTWEKIRFEKVKSLDIKQKQDFWWDEMESFCVKKDVWEIDIHPYVKALSLFDPEATAWFLLSGGKYGYGAKLCDKYQNMCLNDAKKNVAKYAFEQVQSGNKNPLTSFYDWWVVNKKDSKIFNIYHELWADYSLIESEYKEDTASIVSLEEDIEDQQIKIQFEKAYSKAKPIDLQSEIFKKMSKKEQARQILNKNPLNKSLMTNKKK